MKKLTVKSLWSIVAAALALTPIAAASPFDESLPKISWEAARDHYGETCIVYGTIVAAKDIGSRCFLNFHENFRENFTVVVNQESYAAFPDTPDRIYFGKNVRVVGEIIEFNGKPEIVVTSPEAIEVVDDPNPPAGEAPAPSAEKPAAAKKPAEKPAPAHKAAAEEPPAKWTAYRDVKDGIVKIATYNVFNFFDDFDDPYVENERLPGKSKEELALLAKVIHEVDADLLALEEVENRPFVSQFVHEYLGDMGYAEVVFFEGNSDRGIDVALLSRFPVGEVTSHRHFEFADANGRPMRFQRDLLQARIEPKGYAPFDVYVVHLKSKYGGEEVSLPVRMGEANTVRKLFNELLTDKPDAPFVICGDFNDTFESKPVQTIVGQGPKALRTFVDQLPEEKRITFNKEPYRSMIDFIFASPAMGKWYVEGSYDTRQGSVEDSGSDHNPVMARFRLPRASGN